MKLINVKQIIRHVFLGLSMIVIIAVSVHLYFVYKNGKDREGTIDEVALGIIALGFALKQFLDSGAQLDTITDVAQQLSTQFLAPFPKNLVDIKKFVEDGRRDEYLKIMVDYAGYGYYSDPDAFLEYRSALERCAANSKIQMLIYANSLAKITLGEQWPDVDSLKGSGDKEATKRQMLRKFFDNNHRLIEDFTNEKHVKNFVTVQVNNSPDSLI